MQTDPETRRLRAKQVGMLMQAYRHAYQKGDGRKSRLSQEGLLHLMGQIDPQYLERYNHSTVARWESGATRPNKSRLEVFGQALELSGEEIQGMLWLAGLGEDQEAAQSTRRLNEPETPRDLVAGEAASDGSTEEGGNGTYAGYAVRFILTKFAIPGLIVGTLGYILARMGWNAGWVMALYVILAVVLVLVQNFLKLRRTHELRELYFITVFFLISGNLLQAPAIRMDPYGFYMIGDFANTPMPYLLATIVNLLLALAAGLMFDFLWRWQYRSSGGFANVYQRAAWTAFPPLIVVYAITLVFCSLGTWVYLLLVFSILGGTIMAILVIRDGTLKFTTWEKRLLMQGMVGAVLVLTAIGGAVTLILYLHPSPMAIPDHSLIRSWDIDFAALGYSPDELMERYRFGAVLSSLATIAYMVIVLGGCALATVSRLKVDDTNDPANFPQSTQPAAASQAMPRKRSSIRFRLKEALLGLGIVRRHAIVGPRIRLRKP